MSVSTSRLAYAAHMDLLQKAYEDPHGIRVEFPDTDAAWRYRLELHYARKLDRVSNAEAYNPGDPMYGVSIYDSIRVTIEQKNDKIWLYLKQKTLAGMKIESLSEVEDEPTEVQPEERRA